MARKQTAAKNDTVASESEPTITKAEAIRRAIAAGHDQPVEGVAYIKSEFGLDVSPTHFSAGKSQEKSKGAIKKAVTKRAARTSELSSEADLLSAMESLKPLVASLGVEKVKRLAELLG